MNLTMSSPALNAVYPYDWAAFLKSRIEAPGQPAPLAGIETAGYRLVWKEEPNRFDKARMEDAKNLHADLFAGLHPRQGRRWSAIRAGTARLSMPGW